MRHKDPELMNRIKQYISEYYLENAGAMPTITQIASAMKIVRSTAYTYLVAMDSVFCQVLFPEKSVEIPFFQQGIFPAFSGHYASLRMRACSIR